MEKKRGNAVLFPFMAQGHIRPFLALAEKIEQMGYSITFVNTPLNIKNLKNSLPSDSSIKLLEIPFNSSHHGLPPDTENSDSLPYHLTLLLVDASLSLKLPFRDLFSNLIQGGENPFCVISDYLFGWAAEVSHEFGIFNAIFSMTGGFGMACYHSIWLNLPHKHTEFQLPEFPEAGNFHITQLTQTVLRARNNDFPRRNLPMWSNADAILFNTVEELDETGLMYFHRKLGIPVCGIGPIMLSEQDMVKSGRETTVSVKRCIEWLNDKEANSVIYVSFGSQITISESQMMNLAKALDSSDNHFVWVLRPPLGFNVSAEFKAEQWLPEGFMNQIQDQEKRGLIIEKWEPQVEILSHPSVAAFLGHCGWNSVLESLKNGVPLLGWPIAAEQFYNSKFLVEQIGVCVEVARGVSEVKHQDIMEKIELIMGENETGKEIRRTARKIKEMMRDAVRDEENNKGSSVKALENLLLTALLKKQTY